MTKRKQVRVSLCCDQNGKVELVNDCYGSSITQTYWPRCGGRHERVYVFYKQLVETPEVLVVEYRRGRRVR